MSQTEDRELQTYRNLIEQPEEFSDGFSIKTVVGALMLGLLITPGALYIMLVAGEAVGPAARWVTIFLFAEVAKRSLKDLRQQEVFVLYYMTSIVLIQNSGLLWNVYMVQNEAWKAMGISQNVPDWVVPKAALASGDRTFLSFDWLPAIALITLTRVITRVDHFGLGYFLYRWTNDVERLPFPMAPIGASGILAMAETKDKNLQWRPACFAIGGVMGLLFGFVYIGIPALTGVVLREPVFIIPIPWIELTPTFKDILPATAVNIVPNLALVLMGMVLPFWAIVGGTVGLVMTFIANPILYDGSFLREGTWFHQVTGLHYNGGILHSWQPGMQTVDTLFNNNIDFYMSFGLGITIFIAVLGIVQAVWGVIKAHRAGAAAAPAAADDLSKWERLKQGNPARGDISIWISLAIYIFSTTSYLVISTYLVDGFPWWVFLVYGFVYTPFMGYAAARIEGLAGQSLAIPMVKEAAFILSGYKGVAIWFAPIPIHNYGRAVKEFRQIELTGTKLTSVIKTEIVTLPIMLLSLVVFSSIIWSQAPLTSSQYPHVQKVWDLQARNLALMYSSTMEGKRSLFFEALNGHYLGAGFLGAGVLYALLSSVGLPVLMIFGVVRGLGQTNPAGLLLEFVGAMLGRLYFQRKFGPMWLKYTPGIFAGFTCGVGLMGMMSVAVRLIARSIAPLDY